jgi:hypothetical protein
MFPVKQYRSIGITFHQYEKIVNANKKVSEYYIVAVANVVVAVVVGFEFFNNSIQFFVFRSSFLAWPKQ